MTQLEDSASALREDFNSHQDQWRAVILVSPMCSECLLGARAVEREVMSRYPAKSVHASVVWIPMLEGDSIDAARGSSGIIARPNSAHFYDVGKIVGTAYTRGPFGDMAARAKASLPHGHYLLRDWDRHRQDAPQWDLYMLYAPGVRWTEADSPPPMPTAWIRHLGRRKDGLSVYWRDTPDQPPREGDLFEAVRTMANETMGPPPAGSPTIAAITGTPKIELLGFPGCPNTPVARDHLRAALASLGSGWTFTDVIQDSLPKADLRRGWPTPTILVNGADLYGMPAPSSPTPGCRLYDGGIPTARDIAGRLRAFAPATP